MPTKFNDGSSKSRNVRKDGHSYRNSSGESGNLSHSAVHKPVPGKDDRGGKRK